MAKKQIVIDNFLRMSPQAPQFSEKNTNYLISGADPTYYLDTGIQEEQIAPLAAALNWSQITGAIEGNIVHIIPSIGGLYSAYFITDTTKVYGVLSNATVTPLGYPSGSSQAVNTGRLAIMANWLFVTYSTTANIYYMSLPASSWNNISGLNNTVVVHLMESFADHLAIVDGSGSATTSNLVRLIDPSGGTPVILSNPFLDASIGFETFQIRNYNNTYLAIAVGKVAAVNIGSPTAGYPENYIFLWDGSAPNFNYSVKVPGKFIDMKVINSILYVAVQVSSGKTCLFHLKSTQLVKDFTTQLFPISTGVYAPVPSSLFDYKNYIGMLLATAQGLPATNKTPMLVYGDDEIGAIEFIRSQVKLLDQITVDYNGNLIANQYVQGSNSTLWFFPTSGTYENLLYQSQWIPVKNAQFLDIFYDTPPQSGLDAINVTVYGVGEDIIASSPVTSPFSINLTSITPTSFLNQRRTRLDLQGFPGDMIMIKLTTVNTTWQPIIREIVLTVA